MTRGTPARATVLAIADELAVDGLILRYRTEETDDGLQGEEGAFAICSFWLVSALVEIGELKRAHQLAEKLLSFASPLGLYAEEIDANSEFTLDVDLSGAGGTFDELATVDPAGGTVSATLSGLEPGHRYEWYASVSDCAHVVETPVQRFTTP